MANARASQRAPLTAPKDRALRADVRRLGALIGDLLRELAPAGVYETVEKARRAARRRRRGDAAAGHELRACLSGLDARRALEIVRAFSAYFGVVNTAEQVHRMRRRADYLREGVAQPASLRAVAADLAARGVPLQAVREALAQLVVEPVFTAHPTEAVRRTILKKEQRLARGLVERNELAHDPERRSRIDRRIELEIASAWQTDEDRHGPPSVADEVEHALFFLSEVLYPVLPALHEELERALSSAYGERVTVDRPVVRFASWVGGDMDGHPGVGPETIRATLARHHDLVLRRYADELRGLHEHLSQSTSRVPVDAGVLARAADYAARFPDALAAVPGGYEDMPYRKLLWLMSARLERARHAQPGGYAAPQELHADLACIAASLERHRGARAGLALVRRAQLRVQAFGFHLAALDVRQDAAVHRRVAGALLGDERFAERTREERAQRLARALDGLRAGSPAPHPSHIPAGGPGTEARDRDSGADAGAEIARTLEVFRALAEVRARYGARALGPFVISMAQGADDALAVLLLARLGGCVDASGHCPLDVAPLFETVDDLERAPKVLRTLAADRLYAAHLATRGRRQVVMLGYSDSNKDGGIAASRIALDDAQRRLVAAAAAAGLTLTLFHGRGGSISRGGSKPRAAILAAPAGALAGHARTTEQGEIVGAKFGLRGIAMRTLEVSLGALLERSAQGDRAHVPSDEERAVAATIGRECRAAYRAFVHDEPLFPALFRDMTPIDVIERLSIGSRPARRRAMRGVEDLRAIPWVFAWTQCRAVLPGWFGFGAGLAAAVRVHGIGSVRRAARGWPFLATLFDDVEMVLAKSDLDVAARYADLAGDVGARLFPTIQDEHHRAVAALLEVREAGALLEHDPTLQQSIRLRNPYVDPMSLLQVDALRRWRAGGRADADLERLLVQTVRGIARGLRNTG